MTTPNTTLTRDDLKELYIELSMDSEERAWKDLLMFNIEIDVPTFSKDVPVTSQ